MLKKILALWSLICPGCNIARIFPESKFARMRERMKIEKKCPGCKAYWEIFGKKEKKNKEDSL